MKKTILFSGLIALIVSLSSSAAYFHFQQKDTPVKVEHISNIPSKSALFTLNEDGEAVSLDFNETAKKVIDGVVHIKSSQLYDGRSRNSQYRNQPSPFRDFFGEEFERFFRPQQPGAAPPSNGRDTPVRVGTGSGVIVSQDGYIVTNNHVVAEADDIEVTLHDNRTYKANVVGTDPTTDLAVLQIKENNLPTVPFINSDEVQVGQWVLAVGNPLGLNSTVTAGIISAKGRNINILKEQYAVENFIQTDAAINPGNSGGALVNLNGGLVGINTAIASPTGTFAGYGFAVPANIVNKVVEDLIEFGTVQRGVLGVMIRTIDGNFAKDKKLDLTQGVYVDSLLENSAAGKAGVKVGDVITAVDDIEVNTSPELQGIIARHRPGEEVKLSINRRGEEIDLTATLNSRSGNTSLASKERPPVLEMLGAELENISPEQARDLDLEGGVRVKRLYAGKIRRSTEMREGFIITQVDRQPVKSVSQLTKILEKKEGGVMLEGVYEELPGVHYYAFGLDS
ncbi:MAG TPA: Do family serine endopeptidase [Saprospiraceae bacterium]|nr:Do family serine endopeptidase [Saprospiraceae bacterium]